MSRSGYGVGTKNSNGYIGRIDILTLAAELHSVPVEDRSNSKSPNYRVLVQQSGYELGAAWETTSRQTGAAYLSVKLDDPSFAGTIQCRLIKATAEHQYILIWDRRR